jgi:hypothetical protein
MCNIAFEERTSTLRKKKKEKRKRKKLSTVMAQMGDQPGIAHLNAMIPWLSFSNACFCSSGEPERKELCSGDKLSDDQRSIDQRPRAIGGYRSANDKLT